MAVLESKLVLGARAPRPLCHAPRGTLFEGFRRGTLKTAGEAPALPRINRCRVVRDVHAKIPLPSFAASLQVALQQEKVRLCQWQRSGLCRCAKFVLVGH